MSRARRALPILALLAVLTTPARAGVDLWTPLGPDGGEIFSLAVAPSDPDVVYAGTEASGVFRSADRGETWTFAGRGLPRVTVRGLAVDAKDAATVYAALLNTGIYKSTDSGATWILPAATQPFNDTLLFSGVADPRRPRTVYAGTGDGVWWSTNGGATWQRRNRGIPAFAQVLSFATDPRNDTLYAGTLGHGVFRSTDQGRRWRPASSGLPASQLYALAADPSGSGTVLAGTFSGIYRSTDHGRSWRFAGGPDSPVYSLTFQRRGRAYAGFVSEGIFRSTDAGATWRPPLEGPPNGNIRTLAGSPGALFAGITEGRATSGIFRSLDDGATWEPAQRGLSGTTIWAAAVAPADPRTIYVIAGFAGLFKTTDGGASWTRLGFRPPPQQEAVFVPPLLVDPARPTTVYAGCSQCGPLARSDDGGATWQRLPQVDDQAVVISLTVDPRAPSALWITTSGGLFHSADRGATWVAEDLGLQGNELLYDVAVSPLDPGLIYVAGAAIFGGPRLPSFAPRIFRSADGGLTWERRDAGLPEGPPLELALDPTDPATLWVAFGTSVHRSRDSGGSWTPILQIAPGLQLRDLIAAPPSGTWPAALYVARQGFGGTPSTVLRSTDQGTTWAAVRRGLAGYTPTALEVDPSDPRRLYLGTAERGLMTYILE